MLVPIILILYIVKIDVILFDRTPAQVERVFSLATCGHLILITPLRNEGKVVVFFVVSVTVTAKGV